MKGPPKSSVFKQVLRRRKFLGLLPSATAATLTFGGVGRAAGEGVKSDTKFSRDDAAKIIGNARKIVRPGGIERLEAIDIGGIKQWVSVRGADPRNPVLLYLHGGPGYVSMPMNWWFGLGWEEYFTVVHWDQRGSGKTYILNDPAKVKPTLTFERMRADVQEMISWVMKEFGKKKIFLVGHSWGSYLGIQTALHHPEFLHAYVGVSQLTNGPESERRGWSATLAAAQRDGNEEAIRALKSLEPYFAPGRPSSLQDIYSQRKWLDHYGGVMAFRKSNSAESDLSILSPDYTSADISHIWDGNEFTEEAFLAKVLATDLSGIKRIECPVVIFAGRFDTNASSEVAAEWFDKMSAPKKEFVWFENSAHLPMTEEPGKFFEVLLRVVRPIAEPAGDTPPR
jgi:proline iminopeptidase